MWEQASLSPRSGGLGLRRVSSHAIAGYAASLCASIALYSAIDPSYNPDIGAALDVVTS